MTVLFHIASSADWAAAQDLGCYEVDSLRSEGFIHLSTAEQVPGVAKRHYAGRTDLLLLHIDVERVSAEIRYEPVDDDRFPHLYGPLNLKAVVRVESFRPK